MTSTTGLLLAAGAGRRAGGPKALRRADSGETWVERSAAALAAGGCDRVVVVLGAESDRVRVVLDDRVRTVDCPDWAEGMGRSLRTGLEAALDDAPDAVVISLVDLPDVGAQVVARVLTVHDGPTTLARAAYGGRPGHPVLIGRDHVLPMAVGLHGDHGGRAYLERHGVRLVECGDLATGRDVDGPPVRAGRLVGGRRP